MWLKRSIFKESIGKITIKSVYRLKKIVTDKSLITI